MKTLDEVIKAIECCNHGEPDSRCEECPYAGIGLCWAEEWTYDALHYLKEYRKHLIQDLDELRQRKHELEFKMKLDALLQEKPWEKRK